MSLADRLREKMSKVKPKRWKVKPELLLLPQIPKPLHGVAPRIILGSVWWNQTRQEAYRSTNYQCEACGVPKLSAAYHQWLEGHEVYRTDYVKGRLYYVRTVPLCHFCHNYIHVGRLQWLLDTGKIHHAKFVSIIQHGDQVLASAGLRRPPVYNGVIAPWSKWRLVLNRKHYKPLYPTYEDWLAAMDKQDE